ncbi:TlpA family protein disulfide reductase [Pseudomonas sp. MTM4]|uniref:TlpA family protein disulfide reductase n=1 Tax=unclassified Pseudomonas TaxID=196821 RepID=UPI0018D24C70|nr:MULTISPECIES: TlpA disulfide reductase family protein [unclassified Pseudomonas]MBC8651664.1 TlpA family protein disulfide reductase [Pseudomonas sp. MT4]QXY91310.1 TlpA family protein disulfide reductase [Pseudomonas sp. MTM4]
MIKRSIAVFGLLACLALTGCAEDWGPDQHGADVTAQQLEGQWLLINYWAEWCGPCRTEIPELNALDDSHDDITVLGVNFDGLQGEELAAAAKDLGIGFRVLSVDPAERLDLPRSAVLPVTYIVDGDGKVRHQLVGEQTAEGLQEHLAKLGR